MRKLLVFAAFAAMAVAVAACTGDDDDDDDVATSPTASPSPSPTAATTYDVTIGATNWPHATGGARVLQGSTVVYCTSGTLGVASQTWSIMRANLVTNNAVAYNVEVWGNLGGGAGYEAANDHEYNFTRPANTTTDSNFTFDHNATSQSAITWTTGTCP